MKNSSLAKDWFEKGNHDFDAAKILFEENHFPDTICFLLHQSIEKYLKGFLIYNKAIPRKTHNLEELIKPCVDISREFIEFLDSCAKITAYYIETRYPIYSSKDIKRKDAQESIEVAEELISLVKKLTTK